MTPPLFGSKKKGKTAEPAAGATPTPPAPGMPEPLEFDEVPGAPAAATPPQTETVPAPVGSAQALRAVRAVQPPRQAPVARGPRPAAKRAAKAGGAKRRLTPKQLAQRKYAGSMAGVRKRAKKASGGKGRIAKRSGATRLRRRLGLKPGKATKSAKKGARTAATKGSRKKR